MQLVFHHLKPLHRTCFNPSIYLYSLLIFILFGKLTRHNIQTPTVIPLILGVTIHPHALPHIITSDPLVLTVSYCVRLSPAAQVASSVCVKTQEQNCLTLATSKPLQLSMFCSTRQIFYNTSLPLYFLISHSSFTIPQTPFAVI